MNDPNTVGGCEQTPAGRLQQVLASRFAPHAVIGAGVLLRLVAYAHNRSLWIDEAMLASSICQRSFGGLLLPLDYNQGAPAGFLIAVRAATAALGRSELALRLVPFLAGLACLPLFYALARRHVGRGPAVLALALFAVAENLVYYSAELKQYSVDVLASLLLYGAVEPVLRERATPGRWLVFGLTGVVTVWFSHPVIFVLAGVGGILCLLYLTQKKWGRLIAVSGVGLAWLASFAANYWLLSAELAANPRKLQAFAHRFMPLSLSWETAEWLRAAYMNLFSGTLGLPTAYGCAGVAALVLLIGLARMAVKDRWRCAMLVAPLGLCLIASALHKYPFRGRLLLFFAPAELILLGLGAQWLAARRRPRLARVVSLMMLATLLIPPSGVALADAIRGYGDEELRPVLRHVVQHQQPDDLVYVYHNAYPAFWYYREVYGYRPYQFVRGSQAFANPRSAPPVDRYREYHPSEPGQARRELQGVFAQEGVRRVWFLFVHERREERAFLLSLLDSMAERVHAFEVKKAAAYLYQAKVEPGGDAVDSGDSTDAAP